MAGVFALLAALAALAIAGCGGSSDATGSGTTDSGPTITKAVLIKKGDAICRKTDEVQQAGLARFEKKHPGTVTKQKGLEAVILTAALPPVANEIEELDALGSPAADEAKMAAIISGLERALRTVEAKPALLAVAEGPFKGPAEMLSRYGFKDCDKPV